MTFLDELEIVEEIMDFRFCDWIIINDEYCLSIQCGKGKYSIPRENVDLKEYTHFELAFIYSTFLVFLQFFFPTKSFK